MAPFEVKTTEAVIVAGMEFWLMKCATCGAEFYSLPNHNKCGKCRRRKRA
jgi:hypothetical protein